MKAIATLLIALTSASMALMQAYSVEPVKAAWSGWTGFQDTISQTLTCNWTHLDSATGGYVELFAGDHGAGGGYHLDINEPGGGPRVAYHHGVAPGRDHDWVRFNNIQMEPGRAFTKGKPYEFKFTRAGADSLQYYWQEGQAVYPWGFMIEGGGMDSSIPIKQLCMRAYGVMSPVCSTYWAFNIGPTPSGENA